MTGTQLKVLKVLRDNGWHTANELYAAYVNFSQRIKELENQGFVFERRRNIVNRHANDYRIAKWPPESSPEKKKFQSKEKLSEIAHNLNALVASREAKSGPKDLFDMMEAV